MATIAELKAVLKDTLEKRGALGQIKARIRAEVFNALDDQSEPRPPLSHENFLINELIREYLEYNKYKYTASVLTAESGQPEVPLDRQFLVHELNIVEDPNRKSVPLLYGIIAHFLHGSKGDIHDTFSKGSSLQFPRRNLSKLPNERNQMDSIPEPGRMAGTSIEDPLVLERKAQFSPQASAQNSNHVFLSGLRSSRGAARYRLSVTQSELCNHLNYERLESLPSNQNLLPLFPQFFFLQNRATDQSHILFPALVPLLPSLELLLVFLAAAARNLTGDLFSDLLEQERKPNSHLFAPLWSMCGGLWEMAYNYLCLPSPAQPLAGILWAGDQPEY
ncbi:hypothetical protein KIL84_014444 [Mauremys mutica]|uniref:Centrosomal protein 20 n=1 Tax=Mauremys mutica TaxID=74926 RepID=A0A9D3XPR0_9SAUR|nr:hypothetical protein KIL84_014444 [Mauremys mutica]